MIKTKNFDLNKNKMLNEYTNKKIKKSVDLNSIDSNFIKVNSIMNQRLFGLLDYLKASIYFSHYNDKNTKKHERNLEQFFKNTIFKTNPFLTPTSKNSLYSHSNVSEVKNKNKNVPLDIIINFKNNKYIFQKNKYTTPYDLHSKKHNFFKNMVDFSKHIHSESKMEKDFKERYPKVESYPVGNNNKNLKQFFPMTPIIKRRKLLIKTDGFTSTYDDKKSFINKNRLKLTNRTILSFDNKKDMNKNKINSNNLFNNINNRIKSNIKNKTKKVFKANCYYNNLRLKKVSKHLLKYTYLNEDKC